MATSVIHPVVSTSAGRCSPCDPLTTPIPKTLSSGDKSSCSTTSCACLDCHKQSPNRSLPFHFYTHAQWTGSTVKGSCSNSIGGDGDGDGDNNSWPEEHKHRPLSADSLGILGAKKSPIFGRRLKQQKPSTLVPQEQEFFSLRSLAPIYTERKPQIDLSAVEAAATNMPGARTNMDINRNNGYLHNGMENTNRVKLMAYIKLFRQQTNINS
ncbi:uncharacterized protein LOC115625284 [Scaptodrosophila lebanonensis]|uniref:Uncharacterized protein LOC115625284 n=1 Tax=Drosophila lebanonensis TaxID=7225 RepID=A0A6J2TM32_DROLE|nr:uncharacterized protein LOC115625284 [Scaptodrosophila lebanonensis]